VWCVVVNLSIDKEEEESKFTTLPFFLQVKWQIYSSVK
jgi:hypothetical protein